MQKVKIGIKNRGIVVLGAPKGRARFVKRAVKKQSYQPSAWSEHIVNVLGIK
jgi:hypothetical protein